MSRVYVDTGKLRERCLSGEEVRSRIFDDLKRIEDDLKRLGDSGAVSAEEVGALSEKLEVLRKVAENITAVCEYDRYAADRYTAAEERIEDLTEGIRL